MDPTSYALLLALVLSKEELRFEFCHEQGYDTSCVLTVAATLLDVYPFIQVFFNLVIAMRIIASSF
ncbi:MAG: hypothetical protein KBB32_05440 [Spirochaetia bacterium]|nr:hypothetical protein [Spirochaetia bacterium]